MKKIIIALVLIVAKTSTAQLSINTNLINLKIDSCEVVQHCSKQVTLAPVFFNFKKRQLFRDNRLVNPIDFLESCRNIKDSLIQNEIERYDVLTKNKKILSAVGLSAGVCSFFLGITASGIATYNYGNGYPNNSSSSGAVVAGLALASIITTAGCFISTTAPHQKRKEILFRDLPIAYNRYVEIYNSKLINQ